MVDYLEFNAIQIAVLIVLSNYATFNQACVWSKKTLEIVSVCPTTEEATQEAAKIKKCEVLSRKQNCTKPSLFKYHCLYSHPLRKFVEVCAAETSVDGGCLLYDTTLSKIKHLYDVECGDSSTTCADTYMSTDAHWLAPCPKLVNLTFENTLPTINTPLDTKNMPLTMIVINIIFMMIITVSIFIIIWKRRRRRRNRRSLQADEREVVNLLTNIQDSEQTSKKRESVEGLIIVENMPMESQDREQTKRKIVQPLAEQHAVILSSTAIKAENGDNTVVQCSADGSPPPNITWDRYGGQLTLDRNMVKNVDTTPAEYNNTAGNKQDIVLSNSINIDKIGTSWRREDKTASSVSDRHRDNGTMLVIEKTGLGRYDEWKSSISGLFSRLSDDEVCVLFCFLCSDSGTPDFTDTDCLDILNLIRGTYFKDGVTSEEAQRTLDGLKSRGFLWDQDGVHLTKDAKDETMFRVTERTCTTEHGAGLYFVYCLSSYTTAVRYLRSRGYTRESGEKCVISNNTQCNSLLIRRLQMDILTHVTMEDEEIYDEVSQLLDEHVHMSGDKLRKFLEKLKDIGECVQYRGGSQGSEPHVNWLWREYANARPDIVRSCIGLHPHRDIYIINNMAYRNHSQYHNRPPAERCLLYCLLMVDDYTVKVKDESHIMVYNAIRERYFTDLPVCEEIPAHQNPEKIVHVEKDVINFKSDDIRHDVMYAFVTECLVKDTDLKFFLTTASRDVISEYCRSWDYERSDGERCLYIPGSPDEMYNLFIDRLQLDILTHCTVSDRGIHDSISRCLRIPLEVLAWDKDAKKRYVNNIKEQGRKKLFYARGMLVGCAGAGKTTLLIKLMNRETTDEEKHTETTVGLDVHEDLFEIEFDKLNDYKGKGSILQSEKQLISMTDFAGQVAYYACHQVYLSRRAFYLLVVDMSKDPKEEVHLHNTDRHDPLGSLFHHWTYLDYFIFWLQCIKTYCDVGKRRVHSREAEKEGDSNPVIIIASHKDEADLGESTENFYWELKNSLPKTQTLGDLLSRDRYIEVECPPKYLNEQQKNAIESVKRCIVKTAMQLPHWGEEIPLNWVKFIGILNNKKNEGVRILRRDELRRMEDLKFLPEEDLDDMLRFFQEIGHIIYFADRKLRDTVIINVQWFVDAFKHIITDRKHLPQETKVCNEWMKTGRIPESAFQKIWEESGDDSYIRNQNDILPYMEKLGLMTQKLKNSETRESMYYVPSMNRVNFSPTFLDAINEGHKTSILTFHFKTYLPHFFFFRLVVHCSAKWEELNPSLFSNNAAFYKTRDYSHCIVIAVNTTSILLQVFTPGKYTDLQTEKVVGIRSEVEKCVAEITKTFHEQVGYEIGYSCEDVAITDVEESHFLLEDKVLKFGEIVTCPNHILAERSHDISRNALIGFWRSGV